MHGRNKVEIAVVGAGIAGIAVAYYLSARFGRASVVLIDSRQPMSYTSAQSGDNYRNWWPHQTMTDFTNDSIDELDRLATESKNVFQMTRGGYCLATRRQDLDSLLSDVPDDIDVDVISKANDIRSKFPALSPLTRNVIHIRRGGDISGQQLGQYLLQEYAASGGRRMTGEVTAIERNSNYELAISSPDSATTLRAELVVNAAGPFAAHVAAMLDVDLPIKNVYQQKLAFEDARGAIPRDMPFSIDLDSKYLDWSDEEKAMLMTDDELAWLAKELPAGTHCRPDGGANGRWVKLGWAINQQSSTPQQDLANEPAIDASFPEVLLRGASSFIPALTDYVSNPPSRFSHYGGYYTMTEENWPIIGSLDGDGAYVIAALSGFGSMAACAAGRLCAAAVCNEALPDYADDLSLARYSNEALMAGLRANANKGLL